MRNAGSTAYLCLLLTFLLAAAVGCPSTHECSKEPHSRVHPFVFWDQADVDAVLAKIEPGSPDRAWAEPIYNSVMAGATGWLTADILVPEDGGGWSHEYVCPNHGVSLVYDPDEPHAHLCPAGGEIWTGEPYDSAWGCYRHNSLAQACKTLGLAGLLETDPVLGEAYAIRARDILLDYAAKYPAYPIHDRWGGVLPTGAKAFAQTLSEAVWLLSLVAGYDSIYDSGVLTQTEKYLIEDDLLCASVNTILRYDAFKSNWQAWHNAALSSVGFLLEDPWLIDKGISGIHGFNYHMNQGVLDDGLWFEGALSYHYYTLQAYRQLSEAAFRSGVDLYANDRYRMMYEAPVDTMFPNQEFPRINDVSSSHDSVRSRAAYYEVANTRWNGDKDNWLLDRIYTSGTSRSSWEALLYGSAIDDTISYELPSVNLQASGLGILRAGEDPDKRYLLMDYGPHGSGHGHFDKLGIILYASRELLPDMGTVKYSLPQYEGWYKKTLSHNSLMMGEANQLPGGESPRAIDYFGAPDADLQVMQATVGGTVYAGAGNATRTLCMIRDDYVVDVVSASGGLSPYDLVYHVNADSVQTSGGLVFSDIPAETATRWAFSPAGHAYLQPPSNLDGTAYAQIQGALTSGTWGAVFSQAGSQSKLHLLAAENAGTSVIAADAPSNPYTEYHPMLILRQEGSSESTYVCVLEPFEGTPAVSSVTLQGDLIEVQYGAQMHRISVDKATRVYSLEIL